MYNYCSEFSLRKNGAKNAPLLLVGFPVVLRGKTRSNQMSGCERHAGTSSEAPEELEQLLGAIKILLTPGLTPMSQRLCWVSVCKRFVGRS